MAAVFIPQSTLTDWSDAGKVRVDDTTLILIKEARSVDLTPAVRFTALEFGDEDPNTLIGKVKTVAQLKEMGAEHMAESVIYGDMAYKVVEGFMGDLSAPKPLKSASPKVEAAPKPEPVVEQAKPVPEPIPEVNPPEADDADDEAAALSKLFLETVQ